MTFGLDIGIRDSVIIHGNKIILELLLNSFDLYDLLGLYEHNHRNDYLRSMYSLDFDKINYELSSRLVVDHLLSNVHYCKYDMKEYSILYYAIKDKNNQIIGSVSIYDDEYIKQDVIEIGIFIDQKNAGQGFATEAVNTIINFIKNNSQIKKIKWICNMHNIASVKIANKCDFSYVGTCLFGEERTGLEYELNLIREQ